MIAKFTRLHVFFHCSTVLTTGDVSSLPEVCLDDSPDEMSALQVPMFEPAALDKDAEASDSHVVLDGTRASLLQLPTWNEKSGTSVIAEVLTAHAHRLLAARWKAFYITGSLCFVSLAWFCASLCYHAPTADPQRVLAMLEPQPLVKTQQVKKTSSKPVPPEEDHQEELRAAVGWAMSACFCLGLVHWSLGALPGLGVQDGGMLAAHSRSRLLEVLGVGSGFLAAGASHMRLVNEGSQLMQNSFAEQLLQVLGFRGTESRTRGMRLALIAGAFYFAALLVQGPMLGSDVHNGGQLLNVSGFDAFIVTAAFAVLFNEACSCRALVGMTIIRSSSLAVAALMSHVTLSREEVGAGVVSCCLLVGATLCTRLSVRAGVSPFAVFVLGSQAAALMSTAHCAFGVLDGRLHEEVGGWVVAEGLALAVCYAFGLFCVAKALSYPFAGICTQIWGSNVVLVLAFEALRDPFHRTASLAQTQATLYPYHWPVIAGVVGVALGAAVSASVEPCPGLDDNLPKVPPGFALSVFGFRLIGKELDMSNAI